MVVVEAMDAVGACARGGGGVVDLGVEASATGPS